MVQTAIEINNVSFKYKNSETFALKQVSMDIKEREFVILAGYSGSGKSTLLKCINGLIPHFYSGRFGGEIKIFDQSTLDTTTAHLAKQVGFVFQNPENQLSNLTVEREIAFPLENFGVPREEIFSRVEELIELLRLEKIRKNSPYAISGGEQQLTSIAAALALDPPILVLDEVTAHLSPKSANYILNLLKDLNKDLGKTILITEHRLDQCIHFADKFGFMSQGHLIITDTPQSALLQSSFPQEMLPKIPLIYKKLSEEGIIFKNESVKMENDKFLPLTVEDFIHLIDERNNVD
ncbi:MAG: ABC transporter ATP-binding protein [Candidatus Thorarchaeota archaeon]